MNNLKVLFFSSWFDNPYKTLLIKNLNIQGVEVDEHKVNRFFLFKALQVRGLDVIHFHEIPLPLAWHNQVVHALKFIAFIVQIFILKRLGVKIVWTVHEWDQKLSSRKVNFNPLYARIFGSCFDAFIIHCETAKKNLVRELGDRVSHRAHVIHHGNYMDWYENVIAPSEARRSLNIANDDFVFLLFGSIYPHKGVLEAIAAFQKLQHDKTTLLLVGSVKSEALKKTIEDNIKDSSNIRLIAERIEDDDVQKYMNANDCVLVPYKVFTTSGVAILAMSFDRVCIAPKVGFFDDLLDDSGAFFYNPDEANGLFQAMATALSNRSALTSMGKHNHKLAKQWDWHYVAEKTLKVYQS